MGLSRLFLLLVGVTLAQCQLYNVTSTWSINQTQYDVFVTNLRRVESDTYMYHWGDLWSGLRYNKQGFVGEDEVLFFDGGYGVGGGGFYLSTDKFDSAGYGLWPNAVLIPEGTLVADSATSSFQVMFQKILQPPNGRYTQELKVELGKIIPFIDYYWVSADTWVVTHSAKPLQNVKAAFLLPNEKDRVDFAALRTSELDDDGSVTLLNLLMDNKNFTKWAGPASELLKLTQLIRYLGPMETICRVKNDHKSLLDELKNPDFVTFSELFTHAQQVDKSVGFGSTIWGEIDHAHKDQTPLQWARNLTRVLLPKLYKTYKNVSYDDIWRAEEKAGHTSENGTQLAAKELQVLRSNPYITLEVLHTEGPKNRSWVKYWYPDVFRYNSSLVSAEVHQLISSYPREKIEQNTELRRHLNKILMEDLLATHLVSIWHKRPDNYDTGLFLPIQYIMPAEDMRTLNVWSWLGTSEKDNFANDPLNNILYDGFEAYLSSRTVSLEQSGYTRTVGRMAMSAVSKMFVSIAEDVDAPSLTELTSMWDGVDSIWFAGMVFDFNVEQCSMMRQRKWTELFDSVYKSKWTSWENSL